MSDTIAQAPQPSRVYVTCTRCGLEYDVTPGDPQPAGLPEGWTSVTVRGAAGAISGAAILDPQCSAFARDYLEGVKLSTEAGAGEPPPMIVAEGVSPVIPPGWTPGD